MDTKNGLPDDWKSSIRFWAIDQPAIRKITAIKRSCSEGSGAFDLRLVLSTAADAYGDVLAPFIERRSNWTAALEARLSVPVELEHYSSSRGFNDGLVVADEIHEIWPQRVS